MSAKTRRHAGVLVETNFDALPKDWREERIETVYRFTSKPRGISYSDFERIPFIPMNLIPQEGATQPSFFEKMPNEISSGTYFEKGDLLLSKITPSFENGKQAIASNLPLPFGIATTEVIPIQAIEGISDIRFLFYYLLKHDVRQAIAAKMEGSTGRQRVPEHVVRQWLMPIPPLPEQRKIATVLSKVQQAIATEVAIVRNARDLKKSLLRFLFTHGLRGEPLKETVLGSLPESWDVKPLFRLTVPTETVRLPIEGERQIKYVDVSSVSNQLLKVVHTIECRLLDAPGRARKKIRAGDIIFATVRPTLKRLAFIGKELDNQVCSTAFCVLRAKRDIVDSRFMYYAVQRQEFVDLLERMQMGASYPAITDRNLKAQQIPVPSLAEQDELATILCAVDEKSAAHEAKQKALENLFKTMLHKLMTAQIRVNHLVIDSNTMAGKI